MTVPRMEDDCMTRNHRHPSHARLQLLALALAGLCAGAAHADYVFTTVEYPGASMTDVRGINNAGEIVGYARDSGGNAFSFRYAGGVFSRLPAAPGGLVVTAHGINDAGVIVGSARPADGSYSVGFILTGGTYSYFSYPGRIRTHARAIDNAGRVTGYAEDGAGLNNLGFLHNPSTGTFSAITASGGFAVAQGINSAGQVVGSESVTVPGGARAFLRQPSGAMSYFQIAGRPTRARGISNTGLITGFHNDGTREAAFVGTSAGYQLLYVNPTDDTIGEAINDAGQISGLFIDSTGTWHGFIATPAAMPTGTTSWGAYTFSVDVVANVPVFIDPEVALGYQYVIGRDSPAIATVRLPIGIGDNRYTLQVGGHRYSVAAGELFDFRAHGYASGVRRFRVTGIEGQAGLDPDNPYAFPTQLSFVASGRFSGTMQPLCEPPGQARHSRAQAQALKRCAK
jgi:probable HAF family extracellular repeat protein